MEPFGGVTQSGLKPEIVQALIQILDDNNELVQVFRTARDRVEEGNTPEFKIQLYNVNGAQEYQLPSSGTLGGIVFQPDPNSRTDYDMIVEYRDRQPKRINKLHSSYMSLQFPLLFVYGQPDYNTNMTLKPVNGGKKRSKLTMNINADVQVSTDRIPVSTDGSVFTIMKAVNTSRAIQGKGKGIMIETKEEEPPMKEGQLLS
ncbi:hypothetical protein CTI12_AA591480 [Artemisia annua]|uniref:Helitron helicase-like domain-containing protein n=1 Tax=Artemisia annua TaxID=35608 RepID=A0A2U1KKP7_ARTAN|nr:hypothetical protein CTI12_AA591480 [Artemisia annua]